MEEKKEILNDVKDECLNRSIATEVKREPESSIWLSQGIIKEEKEICSDVEEMHILPDITAKVECLIGNLPIKNEIDTVDTKVHETNEVDGNVMLNNVPVKVLEAHNIAEIKPMVDGSDVSEYHCQECGKDYPNRRKFKQHILIHMNLKKFECSECKKCFRLKCQLKKHVVLHDDVKTFACKLCNKSFKQKVTLRAHILRHENVKQFKCEFCSKSFIQKYELKKHRVVHVKRFPCRECGKHFFTEENLSEHSQEHSVESMTAINHLNNILLEGHRKKIGRPPKTNTSNTATSTATITESLPFVEVYVKEEPEELACNSVTLEENTEGEIENIQCDENKSVLNTLEYKLKCGTAISKENSELTNKYLLSEDKSDSKGEFSGSRNEYKHQSSIMDTYSSLMETYRKVINENQNSSQEDNQNISTYGNDFIGNKESQEGVTSFYCHKCDKAYTTRKKYIKHIVIHKGVKRFECLHCNKLFRVRSDLDKHIVIHDDTKIFKCDECGKSFKQKYNLNTHKLIHEGIKKFICSICDKSFILKANLKQHLTATHLRLKRFKCEVCGKEYGHSSTLRSHMATHISL